VAEGESHPIRNGVIATVIGGILLTFWPAFRHAVASAAASVWTTIAAVAGSALDALAHRVAVPVWLVIVVVLLAGVPILKLMIRANASRRIPDPETQYTDDVLFGAKWHWRWSRGEILDLQCLCPVCEAELVYLEHVQAMLPRHGDPPDHTRWICEHCREDRVNLDGRVDYGLGAVRREIRRRVRSGEWASNKPIQADAASPRRRSPSR